MPRKYYRRRTPYYRRKKKYYRRRYRYRKSNARRLVRFGGNNTVMPQRALTKLRYMEVIDATPSVALYAYQFKINDLYDPNYTGAGHQPRGFDQLAYFYNMYRVHACKVTVRAQISTANIEFYAGIYLHTTTTTVGDLTDVSELKNSFYKVGNNEKPVIVSRYANIANLAGKSKYVIKADDKYSAATNASPAELIYATIFAQAVDQTTSIGLNLIVELTFFSEFNEPKALGDS